MSVPCLILPYRLRRDYKHPRTVVYSELPAAELKRAPGVACVGDVVSSSCLSSDIGEKLILLFDGVTRRGEETPQVAYIAVKRGFRLVRIRNPPGTISLEAMNLLCSDYHLRENLAVAVEGEEDMLALPLMQCLPPGWFVVYGVPGLGVAVVRVTRRVRFDAAQRILGLVPGSCRWQSF
ncbi:MAG: DUF359 domain-containing protein [Desulfurococcales archaeon]|nr:DUF359 domain-containing protein [Desulfurococcales archaeon]